MMALGLDFPICMGHPHLELSLALVGCSYVGTEPCGELLCRSLRKG